MENRTKIRELIESMNAEQRQVLSEELRSMDNEARPRVSLEEITAERLRDPEFSARLRGEINAAIRGDL